jgi:hypothetical protein
MSLSSGCASNVGDGDVRDDGRLDIGTAVEATTSTPPAGGCALNKLTAVSATASSVESSAKVAAKAIDNNSGTRW